MLDLYMHTVNKHVTVLWFKGMPTHVQCGSHQPFTI